MEIEITDCMQVDLVKALHNHRARKEWDLSMISNVEISHRVKNYHPELKIVHQQYKGFAKFGSKEVILKKFCFSDDSSEFYFFSSIPGEVNTCITFSLLSTALMTRSSEKLWSSAKSSLAFTNSTL